MFSNLPNLAVVFGYLNASWTLRSDINADFICRVLERMRATGATIAEPVLPADHLAAQLAFPLTGVDLREPCIGGKTMSCQRDPRRGLRPPLR